MQLLVHQTTNRVRVLRRRCRRQRSASQPAGWALLQMPPSQTQLALARRAANWSRRPYLSFRQLLVILLLPLRPRFFWPSLLVLLICVAVSSAFVAAAAVVFITAAETCRQDCLSRSRSRSACVSAVLKSLGGPEFYNRSLARQTRLARSHSARCGQTHLAGAAQRLAAAAAAAAAGLSARILYTICCCRRCP